jgi:hypothetical protein
MVEIPHLRRLGDPQSRQAVEQDLQGDLQFQPRQRRTDTEMDARAE